MIVRDVGRGSELLAGAAAGELDVAARSLASAEGTTLICTGFLIPSATPPAAETDGPIGAACLAALLALAGRPVRCITDQPCAAPVRGALDAIGDALQLSAGDLPLDVIEPTAAAVEHYRMGALTCQPGVSHVVFIERPGPNHHGAYLTMRGTDISSEIAPLDQLTRLPDVTVIAIGDGGNEVGMGKIPRSTIAQHVPHGAQIACSTSSDSLIIGAVSNWGAWALTAAIAVVSRELGAFAATVLDEQLNGALLDSMLRSGAVDGVTAQSDRSVDGLPWDANLAVLRAISETVAWGRAGS